MKDPLKARSTLGYQNRSQTVCAPPTHLELTVVIGQDGVQFDGHPPRERAADSRSIEDRINR